MAKEEWGVKRQCPNCGTRFYDLNRDPMECPNCHHTMTLADMVAGKGVTTAPKETPEEADELDVDLEVEEVADDLDDELIEEEDDTVSIEEVVEVEREDDES